MSNSVGYAIAAYVASAALYIAYVTHLWSTERRLGRKGP
jgi:hypothetical protein